MDALFFWWFSCISYVFLISQTSRSWLFIASCRKAWCPLLNITQEEDPTQNIDSEDENSTLEKFFLKILERGDVNVQGVDE